MKDDSDAFLLGIYLNDAGDWFTVDSSDGSVLANFFQSKPDEKLFLKAIDENKCNFFFFFFF